MPKGLLRILLCAFLQGVILQLKGETSRDRPVPVRPVSVSPFSQDGWSLNESLVTPYFAGNLSEPYLVPRAADNPRFIYSSPNRQSFFLLRHWGSLATDGNVFQLCVYTYSEVSNALTNPNRDGQILPSATATFESRSSKWPGIKEVQWSTDGNALFFLGTKTSSPQVYRLDVKSSKLTQLTAAIDPVICFEQQGDTLIFQTLKLSTLPPVEYPYSELARSATGNAKFDVFSPAISDVEDFISFRGREARLVASGRQPAYTSLSPDGRWLLIYDGKWILQDVEKGANSALTPQSDTKPTNISEVDGAEKNAGFMARPAGYWFSDSHRVLLVNTTIPSQKKTGEIIERGRYLAEVDVIQNHWNVLAPMIEDGSAHNPRYIRRVVPLSKRAYFRITWEGGGQPRAAKDYDSEHQVWIEPDRQTDRARDESTEQPQWEYKGVSVNVRQSANEFPWVEASLDGNKARLVLPGRTDHARFAVTERFEWPDRNGHMLFGALLLPRQTAASVPLPLVIQVERGFDSGDFELFQPDGIATSGFAAQALVSQGFAVLRISGVPSGDEGTRDEGPEVIDRLESAVAALAARRVVDPERVGLVGFSRAGYHVYYTISHPSRYVFKSAAVLDAYSGGYYSYLADAARYGEGAPGFETMQGGSFWKRKAQWLEHETTFNADRVRTPTLFTTRNDIQQLAGEEVGAFALNNKPIEYLIFRDGEHHLVRPRERLAAMQAVLDWMNYWLKDVVPSDPDRAARWAILRKQQDEVLKTPPPPKGKWVFVPESAEGGHEEAKTSEQKN